MILSLSHPSWSSKPTELSEVYTTHLKGLMVGIEHVGSTAVPGLAAKPILDIELVMEDYTSFPEIVKRLDVLGYVHTGDQGIFQREAFRPKSNTPAPLTAPTRRWPEHHLYVCPASGAELRRHVLFRNALRTRADLACAYEKIKRGIEARSNGDRQTYARIKEVECREFVERVLNDSSLSKCSR